MADPFTRAKLKLLDQAMLDGKLTPAARVVFYDITQHINRVSGSAWPSQVRLAGRLGLDLATVKRAISQLRAAGYIEIEKTGRHNTYRPVLNREATGGKMHPIKGAQTGGKAEEHDAICALYTAQNAPNIGRKNTPLSSLNKPPQEIFPKRDHHEESLLSRAREAPTSGGVCGDTAGLSRKADGDPVASRSSDGAIHMLLIEEIGSETVDALHAIDSGQPLKMVTALRRARPLSGIEIAHARSLVFGDLQRSKRAAS